MFKLNDDVIINITSMLDIKDLINLYNSNISIKNLIKQNSEYIVTNILKNHDIQVFKKQNSISFKTGNVVLSMLYTDTVLDLEEILENKKYLQFIHKELFEI